MEIRSENGASSRDFWIWYFKLEGILQRFGKILFSISRLLNLSYQTSKHFETVFEICELLGILIQFSRLPLVKFLTKKKILSSLNFQVRGKLRARKYENVHQTVPEIVGMAIRFSMLFFDFRKKFLFMKR